MRLCALRFLSGQDTSVEDGRSYLALCTATVEQQQYLCMYGVPVRIIRYQSQTATKHQYFCGTCTTLTSRVTGMIYEGVREHAQRAYFLQSSIIPRVRSQQREQDSWRGHRQCSCCCGACLDYTTRLRLQVAACARHKRTNNARHSSSSGTNYCCTTHSTTA